MQRNYTISGERNTISRNGMLRMFSDAFSSKNRHRITVASNYKQDYCVNFKYCSFTGKEKDEETGYGYFGARYIDHELMTMWLSVDPMADKYPSISPYAYCAWNPIKIIDPTGMDTILSFACNTKDDKQNEKNSRILNWMRALGDSPYLLSISMHGDEKTVRIPNTSDGTSTTIISADKLANIISSSYNIYSRNSDEKKPTIVLLYSCRTGRNDNCFGQQLSGLLESSIVIAPVGVLWVKNKNGKLVIENAVGIRTGIKGIPLIKGAPCSWNIFYKGKKVMSFNHSAPQSWINKMGGVNKVIEKILQRYENDN